MKKTHSSDSRPSSGCRSSHKVSFGDVEQCVRVRVSVVVGVGTRA